MTFRSTCILLVALAGEAVAQNPQWGDVTGRIVWGGKVVPTLPPRDLKGHPDTKVCEAKGPLPDEEWVVNSKTKGLRDVVVWLEPAAKGKLPIHPKFVEVQPKTVEIDQPFCLFVGRVTALREGQVLLVKNSSSVIHNFQWLSSAGQSTGNVTLQPGQSKEIDDFKAHRTPTTAQCSFHPWMTGRIRVFDHPYYAVTDADGAFALKNAPVGDFKLKIWHTNGWLGGKDGKDGRPITIKGETKLGDIAFPPPPKES